jgi:small GTP-binding protein
MNDAIEHERSQFRRAIVSVEATLAKLRACPPAERDRLRRDIDQLQQMHDKASRGRIEIVLFGEISTGKSALINALAGKSIADVDVQGGWTKTVQASKWETCEYRIPGFEQSEVILVDTPGINEVGGKERAELAETTARQSDLILFVIDSDINESEYVSLVELSAIQKPMILVMNKRDLYSSAHWSTLQEAVAGRISELVPRDHIVSTAADPRPIECVRELPSGRTEISWQKPTPDVDELKSLILSTLEHEGLDLIAINAAMYAADKSDRVAALRIELRNRRADQVIWTMAATKATVVALSPTVIDIFSGIASDAVMIVMLSKVYGLNFSMVQARRLAKAIAQAAGIFALGELVSWGASAVKLATVHLATPLTMLPQGSAAGFSSYIIGQATKHYFEHGGSWGAGSPKQIVRQILDQTDRDSVLAHLKDEIGQRLAWNRHGRK